MTDVGGDIQAPHRLRLALDLFATGEDLMRQRVQRQHPGLSPRDIEVRLMEWFRERPGAEFGDSPGKPVAWPRPAP